MPACERRPTAPLPLIDDLDPEAVDRGSVEAQLDLPAAVDVGVVDQLADDGAGVVGQASVNLAASSCALEQPARPRAALRRPGEGVDDRV